MAEQWHISKTVSIGTIVGLVLVIAGQLYSYGALNNRIDTLEQTTESLKSDYVLKAVSDQQLLVRDAHINKLNDEVALLRQEVKENQQLLREILTKIHGV